MTGDFTVFLSNPPFRVLSYGVEISGTNKHVRKGETQARDIYHSLHFPTQEKKKNKTKQKPFSFFRNFSR